MTIQENVAYLADLSVVMRFYEAMGNANANPLISAEFARVEAEVHAELDANQKKEQEHE